MAMTTIIHLRAALESLSEVYESCQHAYDTAMYSKVEPELRQIKRRLEADLAEAESEAIAAIRDQPTPGGAE